MTRATHHDTIYKEDNKSLYHMLEECVRNTPCAASLKPFMRGKDGREAFFAIKRQYGAVDKWENELRTKEKIIHNHVLNKRTNYTLEKYNCAHRNTYVVTEQCSDQVTYQLPITHNCVSRYLKGITSPDPDIRFGIASIRQDKTGMLINFEDAAAYLAPLCPVAKERKETVKCPHG